MDPKWRCMDPFEDGDIPASYVVYRRVKEIVYLNDSNISLWLVVGHYDGWTKWNHMMEG